MSRTLPRVLLSFRSAVAVPFALGHLFLSPKDNLTCTGMSLLYTVLICPENHHSLLVSVRHLRRGSQLLFDVQW